MAQEQQKVSEQMKQKESPVCGGWTETSLVSGLPAEEVKKLQGLLDQVREPAQVQAKRTFAALEPLEFATQVVAGLNYRIKAHLGDGCHALFVIYKPISGETVTLSSFVEEKTTQAPTK
ncbi:cystatin-B [Strongylocentrotus purpuratus]|uniref:Cystatin domain-containing protein n=1 Tax=Strongylocentrotus purpuratus TaxID=7668 RepID=A0A7M7RCR2_STRPU|nr:cystatin-B [Strongylocentrotus purpuratus]